MRTSRTDPGTRHLATVAAQAAILRAKARELAQLRAELDRMIVNAYRDHVPASHLADAAGFTRDTIHAAVRPWLGKKRLHPTTSGKATEKTTTKPTKTQATKSTTKPASRTRTTTTTKAVPKAAETTKATPTTRNRRKPTTR
ncbi:MAG: hypothetical protein GEV28_27945 [Actinophytocola sp.]|uniref:hypothetical protein n=1 Tax=Actinophytocola sp. TaxID=1872138 RepID=UPI00132739C2|nr:hypothetical protein [Actinophytocola sp.]MPZ84019.1 hypothetical protein [Actinophytocola sp.]